MGKPTTCTIVNRQGLWYASITVQCSPIRQTDIGAIGLDFGCLTAVAINDETKIEFQLSGSLAHAYQQCDSDISVEWISVDPPRKRVQRHINNTFWFIPKILPYGKDCVVVSPDSVRSRIGSELMAALNNYSENGL